MVFIHIFEFFVAFMTFWPLKSLYLMCKIKNKSWALIFIPNNVQTLHLDQNSCTNAKFKFD